MASIVLLAIENEMAEPLERMLRYDRHNVHVTDCMQKALGRSDADILFLSGDSPGYRDVVRKLTRLRPDLPIIVTNRVPDNHRWLDALDAGATDYCGAPFEAVQVRWILDAAMRAPVNTAA